MKMHELLVPSGNMECLKQAVYNGCDAVYVACKNFGARKFANNFTNEEIVDAIRFCHLYGVKIYVTMNTLVKNNEVSDFIEQARFLHKNGVDALIVQDFGMICYLREKFPNLEIHASTQANISSREVCKLYYDLGVKRVVFARELSIDEIDSIDVPIEREVFIHGALCISYSGCCLMSSMLGGRSGNRGECAGTCRMPYTLKKGKDIISSNQYLLSTKELNTSSEIERLLNSSIYSFKIEGRMKSPLYVGFITRFYRKLIDGEDFDYQEELNHLKTIFNREFTKGRLFFASDSDFMNTKSPNHIGLEIGRVVDVRKDKIKIQLKPGFTLNQNDAIRFLNANKGFIVNFLYDKKMNLVSSIQDVGYVLNNIDLRENDIVCKTQDSLLIKEFSNYPKRKISVSFHVIAHVNQKLFVEINDGIHSFSHEGMIVQDSINAPLTKDNIKKQLGKLGDSPFTCNLFDIEMDNNVFISVRELNEIRRNLVHKLQTEREEEKVSFIEKDVSFEKINSDKSNFHRSCFVRNGEQLDICMKLDSFRIYSDFKPTLKSQNIYSVFKRCNMNSFSNLSSNTLVSDYADYSSYSVIGNYPLNVTNIYTAYYLNRIGIHSLCISVELTEDETLEFIHSYQEKFGFMEFEVFCYGRVENMIIKGNILNLDEDCYDYCLVDFKNRIFPVYFDGDLTHILNCENRMINIDKFIGKCILKYDFYLENASEIQKIVK